MGFPLQWQPFLSPLSPQPCNVKSEYITGAAVKITLLSLVVQVIKEKFISLRFRISGPEL